MDWRVLRRRLTFNTRRPLMSALPTRRRSGVVMRHNHIISNSKEQEEAYRASLPSISSRFNHRQACSQASLMS